MCSEKFFLTSWGGLEYSPNKLIAFTLDESGELIFGNDEIIFGSKYPKAGEETEVTFSLKNDRFIEANK